jgi:hypothetical protein
LSAVPEEVYYGQCVVCRRGIAPAKAGGGKKQEQDQMKVSRISRKFALFIGLAGLVVTTMAAISPTPITWYQLVFFALPPVVIFSMMIPRLKNTEIEGDRNLDKDKFSGLLATSLNVQDYPPCAQLAVAHANAVSMAALASKHVVIILDQLNVMISTELEELNEREGAFCLNMIEGHLMLLRSIQSTVSALANSGSPVTECYRRLPGGHRVMKVIAEVGDEIEFDAVYPMFQFLQGTPPGVDQYSEIDDAHKDNVRKLVTSDVHGALSAAQTKLLLVRERAERILNGMNNDWHNDTAQCWEDYLCKPAKLKAPDSKGMKIISVEDTCANWKQKVEKMRNEVIRKSRTN